MSLAAVIWILITSSDVIYGKPQFRIDNTPPTLIVDRTWEVLDTQPVGSVIAKVRGTDPDNDRLVFDLELRDPTLRNPFAIDPATGVVTLKESVKDRGGEGFIALVSANDGEYPVRFEVYVKIESTGPGGKAPAGGAAGGGRSPANGPHGRLGGLLPVRQPGNGAPPRPPPPPFVPHLSKTTVFNAAGAPPPRPVPDRDETATSSAAVPTATTHATSNSTDLTPTTAELTYTIVPVVVVCGILLLAVSVAFLFRRRICKYRNKMQKEDMRKESHGGMVAEDPIAMQHWRGPIAFGNRYEGWDGSRSLQPPPIQSEREVVKRGDKWEFPRHHLKVFNILGEGCFGQVWRCEALNIDGNEGTTVVAVKTLKGNAGEKERNDLYQELEVMKMLEPHQNVVRLLGCCTEKDPPFLIMEFVALGKLQSFLRNSRAERCYGNLQAESKTLTSRDLTGFAYQCARGMEFLSGKGIVHRDLAARNILLGADHTCKVADFGFARDVIESHVYERKSEGRLPIRWMAPESLYDNLFSAKSDVWSFGVLVWEIVTLGSTPYPGLAAADVMRKVRDGYRLEKPDHCRRELYNIMYYCWDKDPKERPSFQDLVGMLEQLLLTGTDYIELERFPDHSYYNIVSLSGEKL